MSINTKTTKIFTATIDGVDYIDKRDLNIKYTRTSDGVSKATVYLGDSLIANVFNQSGVWQIQTVLENAARQLKEAIEQGEQEIAGE